MASAFFFFHSLLLPFPPFFFFVCKLFLFSPPCFAIVSMDVSDLCMSSDEGSPASDVVMNEYVAFIYIIQYQQRV